MKSVGKGRPKLEGYWFSFKAEQKKNSSSATNKKSIAK